MGNSLHPIGQIAITGKPQQISLSQNGLVLFAFPTSDVSIDLMAIDINSGQTKWERSTQKLTPKHHLGGFHGDVPLVKEFMDRQNPEHFHWLSYDPNQNLLSPTDKRPDPLPDLLSPVLYTSEDSGFNTIQQFLESKLAWGCEYLEQQDAIIISYYLKKSNQINRYLQIIQKGATTYLECQDRDLKALAPNSFFVFKKRLIFTQDYDKLLIFEI